jgi:hypothetical protein
VRQVRLAISGRYALPEPRTTEATPIEQVSEGDLRDYALMIDIDTDLLS